MKKALLINAHQFYAGISSGNLNKAMASLIREELEARGYEVRQTNIEEGYEVGQEVQNHLWADLVVLQSPVYWFGTPWIYKKYIDEVFTAGMVQNLSRGRWQDALGPVKAVRCGRLATGQKIHGVLDMECTKRSVRERRPSSLRRHDS